MIRRGLPRVTVKVSLWMFIDMKFSIQKTTIRGGSGKNGLARRERVCCRAIRFVKPELCCGDSGSDVNVNKSQQGQDATKDK